MMIRSNLIRLIARKEPKKEKKSKKTKKKSFASTILYHPQVNRHCDTAKADLYL